MTPYQHVVINRPNKAGAFFVVAPPVRAYLMVLVRWCKVQEAAAWIVLTCVILYALSVERRWLVILLCVSRERVCLPPPPHTHTKITIVAFTFNNPTCVWQWRTHGSGGRWHTSAFNDAYEFLHIKTSSRAIAVSTPSLSQAT